MRTNANIDLLSRRMWNRDKQFTYKRSDKEAKAGRTIDWCQYGLPSHLDAVTQLGLFVYSFGFFSVSFLLVAASNVKYSEEVKDT